MKELFLETRKCECCGGDELEPVYSDKTHIKTHAETYLFNAYVVICRRCGFCFNSPCPKKEDLNNYYAEYFSINELIPSAYSIDARINILKNYTFKEASFVEVGGNQSSKFHKKILKYVNSIQNVEPNNECSPDLKTINSLPDASIDILAHYDVLEHIPDVKDFLRSCYRVLKNDGIMIVEVPDIKLYPSTLMLFSIEHVNHFSVRTLAKIAHDCGFKLIEAGHNTASRPFSFLAVFKKNNTTYIDDNYFDDNEYLGNLACLKDGAGQINNFWNHIRRLRKIIVQLSKKNKKITLWCVTDFLYRLIDNFELPLNVVVVDSDIRKKDHLKDKNILVFLPVSCLDHIKDSELLIILSPRNKENILEWIKKNTGESFNAEKLEVVGSGLYGEPLQ